MARSYEQSFVTPKTVEQCASSLRSAAEASNGGVGAATGGLLRKMRGLDSGGFYTPEVGEDPFAQFEEKPDFSVGFNIVKFGNNDVLRKLQMSVWDRGDRREVQLVSNGSGRAALEEVARAIQAGT